VKEFEVTADYTFFTASCENPSILHPEGGAVLGFAFGGWRTLPRSIGLHLITFEIRGVPDPFAVRKVRVLTFGRVAHPFALRFNHATDRIFGCRILCGFLFCKGCGFRRCALKSLWVVASSHDIKKHQKTHFLSAEFSPSLALDGFDLRSSVLSQLGFRFAMWRICPIFGGQCLI
jgi:hypothetical protein